MRQSDDYRFATAFDCISKYNKKVYIFRGKNIKYSENS